MMGNKTILTAAALAATFAFANVAQAKSITQAFKELGVDPTGTHTAVANNGGLDEYREYQAIDSNSNGFLDVGDVIRGAFNISQIESTHHGSTNVNNLVGADFNSNGVVDGLETNEWTGIFATKVISRTKVSDGTDGNPGTADDLYNYVFGPDPLFTEAGAADAGKAMIVMYEDTDLDVDLNLGGDSGSAEAAIATAGDDAAGNGSGSVFWSLGFTGADTDGDGSADPTGGEFWGTIAGAPAPQGLGLFLGVAAGTTLGEFNFTLNRVSTAGTAGSWVLNPLPEGTEFRGGGDVAGTSTIETPFPVSGRGVKLEFSTQAVPLPAAAWPGMALMGALGFGKYRRMKKTA